MMKVHVLGIDLRKNVCSLVGLDTVGSVVLQCRAKRETLVRDCRSAISHGRTAPRILHLPRHRKSCSDHS